MSPPKPDIDTRVRHDFPPDQHAQVFSALASMEEKLGPGDHPRIVRCVLHLANGNIDQLQHDIQQAREELRDVIWWAEYDAGEKQLRDFNRPFVTPSVGVGK